MDTSQFSTLTWKEEEIIVELKFIEESRKMMKSIIERSLMRSEVWTEELFFRYNVLSWFSEKNVYIEHPDEQFYLGVPPNWRTQSIFGFRLRDHYLHFNFELTNTSAGARLRYFRNGKLVRSEEFGLSMEDLPNPLSYTSDDRESLVLAYNAISDQLSKKFLAPFLAPLSVDGGFVRSR